MASVWDEFLREERAKRHAEMKNKIPAPRIKWDDIFVDQKVAKPKSKTITKRAARVRWVLASLTVIAASGVITALELGIGSAPAGPVLQQMGASASPEVVQSTPLPKQPFSIDNKEARDLAKSEVGKNETYKCGKGQSVCIPSVKLFAPVNGENTFLGSEYAGFDTLRLPNDPTKAVFYSDGAPLVGGNQGTTLIASHIAYEYTKGAFWNLSDTKPGALIYTTDASGHKQTWVTTRVYIEPHTSFPQEYFNKDGDRQLVVTTCGGGLNDQHTSYQYNIFVVAKPLDTVLSDSNENGSTTPVGETTASAFLR